MKFKSDIEVQAGLKDSSGAVGTSGQVLSSTASGVSWVSQSGFVPYTGATGDVDLGIHQLKADNLAVSTTSIEGVDAGEIVWNSIDGTFDMGLIGGVTLQAGQEMYIYGKATGTILNGEAVMFAGVQGDHILIARADSATINANPEYFIGVSTQDFATNDFGYVTVFGNVRGLDTTAYTLGAVLYYNSASATDGLLTSAVPTAPNAKIEVAAVVRVHATQGILLVRPHVMPKIKDIQDVYAPSPSNDNGLWWNASTSRYENNSIAGILGYTPADDANVVKLTGNQTINGEKTFAGTIYSDNATYLKQYTSFSNQTDYTNIGGQPDGIYIGTTSASSTISMTNLTAFRFYELPDASGTIALTSDIAGYVPYTGATSNVNLGSYSITANSFIKVGGNSTQYLKADGSVSTAMNSRVEVNFVATAGQTTFTTPYEVGQIDVYYNGSKLYPDEFTATNGTSVVLQNPATLNAQISIVKYVAALSTTAIRNETTFTTTAGQTTFSVNYTPGQLDVFYNGSKLNVSEFTATNGTSVVLGFSCLAGESIVIVSYVNAVSGASGTTNYLSKFTGAASLGNSQIFDNGTNVGIATTTLSEKLNLDGNMLLRSAGAIKFNRTDNAVSTDLYDAGTYFVLDNRNANGFAFQATGANVMNLTASGLLGIGTGLSGSARLNILNNASAPFLALRSTNNIYEIAKMSFDQSSDILSIVNNQGASTSGITFGTNATERMRINSNGDVGIGTSNPLSGGSLGKWLTLNGSSYSGGIIGSVNGSAKFYNYYDAAIGCSVLQGTSGVGVSLWTSDTERMRITSGGDVLVGCTAVPGAGGSIQGAALGNSGYISVLRSAATCGYFGRTNAGELFAFFNNTAQVGNISIGTSTTSYNTSSDYRLKQDLKPINGLDLVSQIKVYDYEWKSDKTRSYGVLAHELQEVIPQAVCGEKDAEEMQQVDYSKLVPILIKSIQEQQQTIQELTERISVLENK